MCSFVAGAESLPSFKDVVSKLQVNRVGSSKPPRPLCSASEAGAGPTDLQAEDGGGWMLVVSKSSRKQAQRKQRIAHLVELNGRCLKWLARGHFVRFCKQGTRCFCCKALGHRSYNFPEGDSLQATRHAVRVLVWEWLTPEFFREPACHGFVLRTSVWLRLKDHVGRRVLKPNAVWRLKDHAGRRMSKPNAIWKRISPSGVEIGGSWCVVSEVAAPSNGLHQQGQNPVSAEPRGDDLSPRP